MAINNTEIKTLNLTSILMISHTCTHSTVIFLFCYTLTCHCRTASRKWPSHGPITWQQLNAFRHVDATEDNGLKFNVSIRIERKDEKIERISAKLQLCGGKCLADVRAQRSEQTDEFEAMELPSVLKKSLSHPPLTHCIYMCVHTHTWKPLSVVPTMLV